MKRSLVLLPLLMLLAACGQQAEPPAAAPTATAGKTLDQPAEPTAPTGTKELFAAKLDQVLAGGWRSDANKARDQYRHPKQTLQFFGLKSGDTLIEITPGAGWYAEILAPLMKGSGTYVAAVGKPRNPEGEAARDNSGIKKKFSDDPAEYSEAKVIEFDGKAPEFGPAGSADIVLTFRNVHNWVMGGTEKDMFKAFFDVLKPGGVLGVVDHRAAEGADLEKIKESGYLPQDYVIKLATDAGFKLAAQSEINANPKDTKDYEKGVWTLPPTYELGDKDREKYAAIGESDRMTLKFVKPGGSDKIFHQGADASGADGSGK